MRNLRSPRGKASLDRSLQALHKAKLMCHFVHRLGESGMAENASFLNIKNTQVFKILFSFVKQIPKLIHFKNSLSFE